MIYLISGASHTGKTLLAQRILEEKHIPYLSLDHLKMGLIRSGNTDLTVYDDDNWAADFSESDRAHIRAVWLIMTEDYIGSMFGQIQSHANAIEQRMDDSDLSQEELLEDNLNNLDLCRKFGCEYVLIDKDYQVNIP